MYRYKTAVTDYEGMQETLETCGEQGWKLISVTPDTFRVTVAKMNGDPKLGIVSGDSGAMREISASYYLLVFQQEDTPEREHGHESVAETLDYPEFSLPDY